MVVSSLPDEIAGRYLDWLSSLVNISDNYLILLRCMFNYEFTWTVHNDDNRYNDGLALRERFLDEQGLSGSAVILGPCSVLEMMVALAKRMDDDIMYDPECGDRSGEWFWLMVENLKLDRYSDDNYDVDMQSEIKNILDIMVNRTYAMNGTGGLFPLKHPEHNQRRVEIWYQMQNYILENYVL